MWCLNVYNIQIILIYENNFVHPNYVMTMNSKNKIAFQLLLNSEKWWPIGSTQTSEAEVPGSNPASHTMILMRRRIFVRKCCKFQCREGDLPISQKKILKLKNLEFSKLYNKLCSGGLSSINQFSSFELPIYNKVYHLFSEFVLLYWQMFLQ